MIFFDGNVLLFLDQIQNHLMSNLDSPHLEDLINNIAETVGFVQSQFPDLSYQNDLLEWYIYYLDLIAAVKRGEAHIDELNTVVRYVDALIVAPYYYMN